MIVALKQLLNMRVLVIITDGSYAKKDSLTDQVRIPYIALFDCIPTFSEKKLLKVEQTWIAHIWAENKISLVALAVLWIKMTNF